MSRIIRVATTSLATFEDVKPPFNLRNPTPQENLELGLSMLEAAGAQSVDLAVLPESLLSAGLPYEHEAIKAAAQTVPGGDAFNAIADCARRHQMYVVAGLPMRDGEQLRNVAVLVDRAGELVGIYAKRHPTEGEIGSGIVPGQSAAVFQTDFGRLGIAICFDLNWPDLWLAMADQDADVVCWLSAYPGGFPLAMYAWQHRYRVISSVWTYESRVIDITARTVAETSRWGRIAVCDLNLDKRLFHTDGQMQHLLPIQTKYGQRVTVETLGEEHLFALASNDPELDIEQIIAEFGLVQYADYVARCTTAQTSTRVPLKI